MKKTRTRILSLLLAFAMLCTMGVGVHAEEPTEPAAAEQTDDEHSAAEGPAILVSDDFQTGVLRTMYNLLNWIASALVAIICEGYADPADWKDISEYNADGFLPGRETYQTEAAADNHWSLGYAGDSLIPDDLTSNKYYIGRDLTERIATGVHDDMRVRVVSLDDNSGEGLVLFAVVDSLGVTSTDSKAIRQGVLEYADSLGIRVASVNVSATHSHTALDTQGVATASIYKIFGNMLGNILHQDTLPGLESADAFKKHFVNVSIETCKAAIDNMHEGKLYSAIIDGSEYIRDKRDLISKEDIPAIASLLFVPTDATVNETYFVDISCHPTSFSADYNEVSSDYIYYLDAYIDANSPVANGDGANTIFLQGAVGQLSRDNVSFDETDKTEEEIKTGDTKVLGDAFGKLIVEADYENELEPILNAISTDFMFKPTNTVLLLACKARLVNNQVYRTGSRSTDVCIAAEIGYVEFGHEIGFALFPVELYPEVFWGGDIVDNASWDGTQWEYGAMSEMIDGIDLYAVCLCNDALGYVVTDNYFAFLGHIIGDGVADEILSLGKYTASKVVTEFSSIADEVNACNQ